MGVLAIGYDLVNNQIERIIQIVLAVVLYFFYYINQNKPLFSVKCVRWGPFNSTHTTKYSTDKVDRLTVALKPGVSRMQKSSESWCVLGTGGEMRGECNMG